MSETEPKTRTAPTRAYFNATGSEIILRTEGNDTVVPLLDAKGEPLIMEAVRHALAREMTALLLLRGETIEQIIAGKGLPDRTLPIGKQKSAAPRALTRVKQAIANVRALEFIKEAKTAGLKLGRDDAQKRAEIEVRTFGDAEIDVLSGLPQVRLEGTRLSAVSAPALTFEEALIKARARIGDGIPVTAEPESPEVVAEGIAREAAE